MIEVNASSELLTAEPLVELGTATLSEGDACESTIIEHRQDWTLLPARELWKYRELLFFFIWRDIKVQYKQTVLGAAWAIWQPLLNMVIFSILFGKLVKVPTDGPYPLFVYAGLMPWTFFASAVTNASTSLINQTHLVTKIYFPRVLLPLTDIGSSLVNTIPAFGLYLALMFWYRQMPAPTVILFPLLIGLVGLTALGVGLILSSLMLIYRDVRYVVPSMVQAWMYLTPVIYGTKLIPERYRWLMGLNPLSGPIAAIRSCLLGQPIDWLALGISAALIGILLVAGLLAFHRSERRFADVA